MFVTEDVGDGPPRASVGMARAAIGDVDVGPALNVFRRGGVVVVQFVHAFEVETNRALVAVDFDAVVIFITRRQARGFEGCQCAGFHLCQEQNDIVDGTWAGLAGGVRSSA